MRLYIIRALLIKEFHRHLANRGGIALGLLLVVAALLLSVFNPGTGAGGTGGGSLVDGVHRCLIDYPQETDFVRYLKTHIPDDLRPHLNFREHPPASVDGLVTYPPGTGAIRLATKTVEGRKVLMVWIWHPPGNPAAMAPYEEWFWRTAREAYQAEADQKLRKAGVDPKAIIALEPEKDDLWAVRDSFRNLNEQLATVQRGNPTAGVEPLPTLEIARSGLGAKELDLRSAIATGMVVFALYFACVYLLPTLNCEERERGVLLAQALSPASPAEILTAKFLFYPMMGVTLAAVLAGIYKPALLSTLFFWLALIVMASGFLGIGMTVATLARTQRAAFMGSMCYLLSVALVLFICQQNGIPFIPYLALEYHGPRVLHAAITGDVGTQHWYHLAAAAGLAWAWITAAGWLFRRRGWQ